MPSLGNQVKEIRASAIRRTAAWLALAKNKKSIISFGGGAPSLPPPNELAVKLKEALNEPWMAVSYGATRGTMELREAIREDLLKYGNVKLESPDNIIVTNGGTLGIFASFRALLNPGEEVIITDPTYLGYPEAVKLMNARTVTLPVYVSDGFQPDIEALKERITKRTKIFLLLSPDNPTGRVIKRENAKAIVDLAIDHDFWIVCDDVYKHIIFEGEHIWVSKLPGAEDRTLTICSFSKEASIPGLRLGYSYGPLEVIDAMEKYAQFLAMCPGTLSQIAVASYLNHPDAKDRYLNKRVIPTYRKRLEAMATYLEQYLPEAETTKSQGAFYYFVNIGNYLEKTNLTEEKFADELRIKKNVIVIPGDVFGENGKNHIRMTFVSESNHRIQEGIGKIKDYIDEKHRNS